MGLLQRISGVLKRTTAKEALGQPQAAYFQGGSRSGRQSPLMASYRPQLRDPHLDVQESWVDAAGRAIDSIQNSGFLTKAVEVRCNAVVGTGLRLSCRPDADELGVSEEKASKLGRRIERAFRRWCANPIECDAGGKMTFGKMQQMIYASRIAYGEAFVALPLVDRPGSEYMTKVMLLPPTRLSQKNETLSNLVQGVETDGFGFPLAYWVFKTDRYMGRVETRFEARDRDGRPNFVHVYDGPISSNRGISMLATILKAARQFDQLADATLTSHLLQTVFAAVMKTNIQGLSAFEGMMTNGDTGALNTEIFGEKKGEWYDGAKIDLTQHGRIAHLFPGDELDFKESKQSGQNFDHFAGWLMKEVAAGLGITYESATGDYRGATYSSIRMAGAEAWLSVLKDRENIVIRFCDEVFRCWLDEAIMTEKLKFPGGREKYMRNKDAVARGVWTGPAQPQADDFKAARAHEVLKGIQGTTLAQIAQSYGTDWDDDMRQRAEENRLADELGLPLPWSPDTILQTKDGLEATLEMAANPPAPAQQNSAGSGKPGKDKPSKSKKPKDSTAKAGGLKASSVEDTDAQIEADLAEGLKEALGSEDGN